MRIYIAGLLQETNDFSPVPTSEQNFSEQSWRPSTGAPLPETIDLLAYRGAWEAVRAAGAEPVLGPFSSATPGARASTRAWNILKRAILEDLEQAIPVDGIVLFLHGAQSAQGVDDCEGDLLAAVRIAFPHTPIGVILDLHANISEAMVARADILLSCRKYPHVDFQDAGTRIAELVMATIRGDVRPVMAVAKMSFVAIAPTGAPPMREFVAELSQLEHDTAVLAISALHGFFGADHPDIGGAVIAVTNDNMELAEALVRQMADHLAQILPRCQPHGHSIDSALNSAMNMLGRSVIADRSDNPGAGAPGDATYLLQAIRARAIPDVALGIIWDPIAVEFCHAAGEAAQLSLRVGGKAGALSGTPLDLDVEVLAVRDDVRQARFGVGEPRLPLGRSAAVRAEGIELVIATVRTQTFSRHAFEQHGIDLSSKKIVCVKSTYHFYEDFHTLGEVILCDGPGSSSLNLIHLPYSRITRPLWPLDETASGRVVAIWRHSFSQEQG